MGAISQLLLVSVAVYVYTHTEQTPYQNRLFLRHGK